ncbi:peptide/nickel transport system permease protein [Paucimonas lemoignei]|uniref:Peptide/nickel transport system permease protein n=1 Tax=Paucimonas lemoignei TaxID=29443 RepID=A0A4R3HWW9_PAULE|nr:ABC transporter permease [Paucimonas lemoignei]TCS36645.1 peptide/nickel transport system permease protein [Paucimonas lemoignei]
MTAMTQPQRESAAWQRVVRIYFSSRTATAGALLLAAILLAALLAPLISPQNPYDLSRLNLLDARLAPGAVSTDGSLTFLLGADAQGRDMLSAILYGMRISVTVGVVSTLIALSIGLIVGLWAGYRGGRIDAILMRLVDIQLSFPSIMIALVLLALSGPGLGKIIFALAAAQWAYYARTARSTALVERRKEYIEAATSLGLSDARILFRHLLPNCLPPLIVVAALQVASAISLEATLSFLGLGLPVTEPSLGLLISNGFEYMLSGKYWISLYPGIALLLMVAAITLVADRLRDVLNPRLEVRMP